VLCCLRVLAHRFDPLHPLIMCNPAPMNSAADVARALGCTEALARAHMLRNAAIMRESARIAETMPMGLLRGMTRAQYIERAVSLEDAANH
jgi:hypothetical protein